MALAILLAPLGLPVIPRLPWATPGLPQSTPWLPPGLPPAKTGFMDLSWVPYPKCVDFMDFLSTFECKEVGFDPKCPFQGNSPTYIGLY